MLQLYAYRDKEVTMRDFQGEFLSFNYRGISSADMGIVRVSDGSRLHKDLLPPSEERSITVEGRDGELLTNSWHSTRTFTLDIAYDNISEADKRKLGEWLEPTTEGELYFEEHKYKVYTVRVTDEVRLDFIPFNIKDDEYVYKGEGQITFKAYYPYAISPVQTIHKNEAGYQGSNIPTPETAESLNYNKMLETGRMRLFNAGQVQTPLYIDFVVKKNIGYQVLSLREGEKLLNQIAIDLSKLETDTTYTLNAESKLLLNQVTGRECNSAIVAGTHLFLPPSTSVFHSTKKHYLDTNPSRTSGGHIEISHMGVRYNYLYY